MSFWKRLLILVVLAAIVGAALPLLFEFPMRDRVPTLKAPATGGDR